MANFKSNYSKARNAEWVYYILTFLTFVFFVFAVQALPRDVGSMIPFVLLGAMATGTAFGAGWNKRNAKRGE